MCPRSSDPFSLVTYYINVTLLPGHTVKSIINFLCHEIKTKWTLLLCTLKSLQHHKSDKSLPTLQTPQNSEIHFKSHFIDLSTYMTSASLFPSAGFSRMNHKHTFEALLAATPCVRVVGSTFPLRAKPEVAIPPNLWLFMPLQCVREVVTHFI